MKHLIPLLLLLTLSACGSGALSLLTGGGPNVAANVQAGQENNQAAVQTDNSVNAEDGGTIITQELPVQPTGYTESIVVNNQNVPLWLVLLLIVGWLLPNPRAMYLEFKRVVARILR
jgi:hypothetical protein